MQLVLRPGQEEPGPVQGGEAAQAAGAGPPPQPHPPAHRQPRAVQQTSSREQVRQALTSHHPEILSQSKCYKQFSLILLERGEVPVPARPLARPGLVPLLPLPLLPATRRTDGSHSSRPSGPHSRAQPTSHNYLQEEEKYLCFKKPLSRPLQIFSCLHFLGYLSPNHKTFVQGVKFWLDHPLKLALGKINTITSLVMILTSSKHFIGDNRNGFEAFLPGRKLLVLLRVCRSLQRYQFHPNLYPRIRPDSCR